MKISEKILNLRKSKNMSQDNLAEYLNVSRQAISKWESGQNMPDLENVKLLSKLFNVTIDTLVHDDLELEEKKEDKEENPYKYVVIGACLGMAIGFMADSYAYGLAGAMAGLAFTFFKSW